MNSVSFVFHIFEEHYPGMEVSTSRVLVAEGLLNNIAFYMKLL